jgi:hypothetical protein
MNTAKPEPTLPSRDEFFSNAQQQMKDARRKEFSAFVACAQFVLHKAKQYPFPHPDTEPEFNKNEVSSLTITCEHKNLCFKKPNHGINPTIFFLN